MQAIIHRCSGQSGPSHRRQFVQLQLTHGLGHLQRLHRCLMKRGSGQSADRYA
jgi:hypothetical protein